MQRKAFAHILAVQFLTALAALFVLALTSESDLTGAAERYRTDGAGGLPAGYSVEESPSAERGERDFWLSGVFSKVEYRGVTGPDGEGFLDTLRGARYFLVMQKADLELGAAGALRFSKPVGAAVLPFFWAWSGLFALQIVGWCFEIGGAHRKARRLLSPLAGMGFSADKFAQAPPSSGDLTGAHPPFGKKEEADFPDNLSSAAARSAQDNAQHQKLGDLANVIQRVNVGKLDTRIDTEACPPELRGLAAAINSMLARIDEAYKLQARFVSDASHELRTPISVIQGYASLLDRWGKDDPKTMQESIDAIKSEAEHMKELVEQLLFLARGGSDTLTISRETADLGKLMEELSGEMKLIDPQRQWEFRGGNAVEAAVDLRLIKQVMRILADNAMKYTPEGEKITLQAAVKENGNGRREACLTVQDNGVGIGEEDLPKVFDRFFRADSSRSKKTGGSGLGLSIAKWIVEKHSGHFEVLSREGIGTRMTVCLPMDG